MASITVRGGKFFVRVRREGSTAAKTFTKRSDAVAWGRRVESEMERGAWVAPADKVATLAGAVAEYHRTVGANMKGIRVYAHYFAEFARLPFASKPISEVTPAHLATWRDQQLQQYEPATVTRKLASLSAIFSWAARERGWLEKNPLKMVTKPRVANARDRVLSVEEQRYIFAAAATSKAPWLPPTIKALMFSAMRRGELFGLRRRDVDSTASTAFLPDTKGGCPRLVPLSPDALAALQELLAVAPAGPDAKLLPLAHVGSISDVFLSTVNRARARYEQDCAAAGVEADTEFLRDIHLHDLRHFGITMWQSTGALSLPEMLAISGHSNPRMLMRYTHLSVSRLAAKMGTLTTQQQGA